MTDAELDRMRLIADAMLGPDRDWNWRSEDGWRAEYGVRRERAEDLLRRRGGTIWQEGGAA
jgi:hypothetical protein